jgi:Ulp1 family protease
VSLVKMYSVWISSSFQSIMVASIGSFVAVLVQQKRIGFWDSFGEKGEESLECTLRYLCDEWSSMYNTSMDLSEWSIFSTETPRQHNSKFCLSSIFIELIGTNVLLHLF